MADKTSKKQSAISEPYTKGQVVNAISEDTGLARKDVAAVFASLNDLIGRHLKSRGAGVFTLPGLCKITVTKKAATKARKGVNPFTGQEMTFAAKPARRVVKVRALKSLKNMAD
jgi:nucleoid DNA-binding protein